MSWLPGIAPIVAFVTIALSITACEERRAPASAPWTPLAEVESVFGPLVTAGNHPTPDQHGTGDRVGIFQDSKGTVWGLPLSEGAGGEILVCAPAAVREAKVTGAFTAGATVIGTTNEPTGWRGGTGDLELLLRDQRGNVRWQAVHGGQVAGAPVCWAPQSPGPPQKLSYYRLTPQ
jgi:hypothetical protein